MDDLAALRLQLEWGADEALGAEPLNRFARPAPVHRLAQPPEPRRATSVAAPSPAPASSLEALHAELERFEGCALRATATHTLQPDGNPFAGLVLIGEAPGADDDRSGRAFSGAGGAALDRVLGSIGLDRTGFLATTLVPWRPPGGRKLSEAEIQSCLPFLHRLLALVRPRRLLLLGAVPVRVLAGSSEPLRRLSGRWLDVTVPDLTAPVPAWALPPLDQWLRNPATKQALWNNLMTLRRDLTAG